MSVLTRPDPAPLVATLQALLRSGTRWEARGLDPATGCGCYGLVWFAYGLGGIALPRLAEDADVLFAPVVPPYQAFDVVLREPSTFLGVRHLGLLLSPQEGWHMAEATNGLARFRLSHPFWRQVACTVLRYKEWRCI